MIRHASRSLGALALVVCSCVLVPSPAAAQVPGLDRPSAEGRQAPQIWLSSEGRRRGPLYRGIPENWSGFMFCRLWYDETRSMESGLGWSTDYPAADGNFLTRFQELTPTPIAHWPNGDPGIVAVRATDEDLMKCPFLFMTDPGSVDFSQREIDALRNFLLKGGFLWADDLWGGWAWSYFERQITRMLPEYSFTELTAEHPLFSVLYVVDPIPQIPSAQYWNRSGGDTAELGPETRTPHVRAMFAEDGRLLVLSSYNTDIADGWEREGNEPHYFYNFSPPAYGLAINVMLWAMSH